MFADFRNIELSDRDRANACLAVSDFSGCEYSFANNLAWRRMSDSKIAFYRDFYISLSFGGGGVYVTFPSGVPLDDAGKRKYIELFDELNKTCADGYGKLSVGSVTEENLGWLLSEYEQRKIPVEVKENRSFSDYIYRSSDLAQLKGKKYHGKRNHIKRFKENDWSFEPLTAGRFDECIAFAAGSYNSAADRSFSAAVEQYAIHAFFENYEYLGLSGGALYSGGELAGFTIGERLNGSTFDVHIEKALGSVRGAYPTLCSEFAKTAEPDFEYINREEDLGLEGLRRSKMSYHPAFLLKKYTISFI